MAIVEMKRFSLLAPKEDEKRLFALLQRLRCVHITKEEATDNFVRTPYTATDDDAQMARVHWAIGKLSRYDTTKAPLFGGKPTHSLEDVHNTLTKKKPLLLQTVQALEELEQENGDLRGQLARIEATREQLLPWQALTVPVQAVRNTKHVLAGMGTVRKEEMETLLQEGKLSPLVQIEIISSERDVAYITFAMHQSVAEETQATLRDIGFSPIALEGEGTVAEKLTALLQKEENIKARQVEIEKEMASYAKDIQDLKFLYDCMASEQAQRTATQETLASKSTFYLRGWVPETMEKKIIGRIAQVSPSACCEFATATEDETPPVLLHNNNVVSPFENIVSGFSLPSYTGLDPTAIMMPFFVNFMGMMISDAGYGLLMALLIPILIKCMKPSPGAKRLMWILVGGGVMTFVWGALYNTWFGFAPLPLLFDPVNDPMPVMIACIALGAVHLFTGLGIAAYMNLRKGKVVDAIADQLSWALLIIGLGVLLVSPTVGQWLALSGVAIILVTTGREKTKNPLKRLMSGLGALYGATGWISDLLSYMRLFGMGLATGVIGMVINQLVGMVFAVPVAGWILGPVLFVGGHLFNAGINILGAYVHSCRLQYIEFFGKFYEEGGEPFKPMASTERYCYITESQERA